MACDNCNGLTGFYCPVCQPQGIDTRDIHARAPIDRIKALEAEVERLRAELDAANARVTERLKESQSLRNLLAIIHRDGGHYGTAHGIDKAVVDGMKLVTNTRAELAAANDGFRLLGLSPDAATICRQTRQQNCHTCTNFACGDNQVVAIRKQSLRERDRLRAENARLTSELDAANARIASAAVRVRGLKQKHMHWCAGASGRGCACGTEAHNAAIEDAAREVERV